MDLDVLLSGSVSPAAKTGDANAIEKVVAVLIGDEKDSHPSASIAITAPSTARSDNGSPLAVGQDAPSSAVRSHRHVAPQPAMGAVPTETKTPRVMRSILLAN